MLMPKKVKYRKQQRGRMKGKAWRGSEIAFGEFGLKVMEPGWISDRQIEASRIAMTRFIKRGGKSFVVALAGLANSFALTGIGFPIERTLFCAWGATCASAVGVCGTMHEAIIAPIRAAFPFANIFGIAGAANKGGTADHQISLHYPRIRRFAQSLANAGIRQLIA